MNTLILSIRHKFFELFPASEHSIAVLSISLIAIAASIVSSILFGVMGFAFVAALILFYLNFKNQIILFTAFLAISPLIMNWFWGLFGKTSLGFAALIIAFWFFDRMTLDNAGDRPSKRPAVLIALPLVFIFCAFLSAINNGITSTEAKYLLLFGLFFFYINAVFDIYKPKYTMLLWAAATFPIVIAALWFISMFSLSNGFLSLLVLYRSKQGGFFQNGNIFGGALVAVIPFWLALAIWSGKNWLRILSAAISVLLFLTMLSTNARAAWVGFIFCIMIFTIWGKKFRYFVAAILMVIILVISFPDMIKLASFATRLDQGTSSRDLVWKSSIKIISSHPLVGVGIGSFEEAIIPYFELGWRRGVAGMYAHGHNFVLNLFVNLGVPGLLIALAMYYLSISQGVRALKRARTREDLAIIRGIFGSILAALGWTLFESGWILSFGSPYPDILFWMPLLMLMKINSSYEKINFVTTGIFEGQ